MTLNFKDHLIENYPDILLLDGHDNAIIGVGGAFNQSAVVYDGGKVIENLIAMGMTTEEAAEWMSYNIEGAYVGENTPIIVHDCRFS